MHRDQLSGRIAGLADAIPDQLGLFVKMLGDAQDRFPQGLPDTELQRVFALHRAALSGQQPDQAHFAADRPAVGIQKIAESGRPRLRLVSAGRS